MKTNTLPGNQPLKHKRVNDFVWLSDPAFGLPCSVNNFALDFGLKVVCLQRFETVGWASGRASRL